nr:hypothetical protein [Mucilaginibacter sp. X5P1]
MRNIIFNKTYQSLKRYSVSILCMHSKVSIFFLKWDFITKNYHKQSPIYLTL